MKNIGEKIKILREQSGFTNMNLAKYLKVDPSFILKIEGNERVITTDMLDKLSSLFGVSSEKLINEIIPEKRISIALRSSQIDVYDLEMISAMNRITLNLNFMTELLGDFDDR